MHELLDLIQCATRAGRKTSEFALALVYVVALPVCDAIVRALLDVLGARQALAAYSEPAVYVALAGVSALVVAAYALSRGYVKGKTAAAAARAFADMVTLRAGGYTPPDDPAPTSPVAGTSSSSNGAAAGGE